MTTGLIWQTALIVEDDRGRRWLEFSDVRDCARCRNGTGCGAATFSRLFSIRRPSRLPLPTGLQARPGQCVRAGFDGSALLRAAAAVYLLPLIGFVGGSILAAVLIAPGSDSMALATGIAGATVAFATLRRVGSVGLVPVVEVSPEPSLESCRSGAHVS